MLGVNGPVCRNSMYTTMKKRTRIKIRITSRATVTFGSSLEGHHRIEPDMPEMVSRVVACPAAVPARMAASTIRLYRSAFLIALPLVERYTTRKACPSRSSAHCDGLQMTSCSAVPTHRCVT
jgi:hypothetical protein